MNWNNPAILFGAVILLVVIINIVILGWARKGKSFDLRRYTTLSRALDGARNMVNLDEKQMDELSKMVAELKRSQTGTSPAQLEEEKEN